MTCQDYALDLDGYVDGTLDERAREACAAHVSSCQRCQALVADLTWIRQAARTLDPMVPGPHVWTRIASEVERDGDGHVWSFTWQTVAASTVTVAIIASLSWVGARLTPPDDVPGSLASGRGGAGETVPDESEFGFAEAHFTSAITDLESITRAEQSALDADTADVLQANLTVIDGAISESRAALVSQPESRVAQESLFEALRSKIELLQDIVALINEMRKGNQEGAARIVSGLNQ
jgi:hypothetical protein